jgi:hypothetical protein
MKHHIRRNYKPMKKPRMAPIKDILAFVVATGFDGCFVNNCVSDLVLCDLLDDYEDPRSTVVRSDMEIRSLCDGQGNKFPINNLVRKKFRLPIRDLLYGHSVRYSLSDGTDLYVEQVTRQTNRRDTLYIIEWAFPCTLAGTTDTAMYCAVLTPVETEQLMNDLGYYR